VRASYSSRSDDRCKGSGPSTNEFDALAETRVGLPLPLTPAEKDRRIALLRAILRHAAPTFQARIDAGEQGARP
jgi:hypothetical protein